MLRRPRLFFFALAFLLWALNRLANPDQEAVLSFRAQFAGFPDREKSIGLDSLPERVSLRLHGRGFDLLGLALKPGRNVQFDLPQEVIASAADSVAWIDWNRYKDDIRKQLPGSVALLTVESQSFALRFRSLKSKMLAVDCVLPRGWRSRYRLEDLRVEPDSVRVFGWSSKIDKLRSVRVLWPVSQRDEAREVLELPIVAADMQVFVSRPDRVLVRARPVQLSSSTTEISLPKPRVGAGLRSVLSPAHSTVYSTGSLDEFEEWNERVPVAVLDSENSISEPGVYSLHYHLPEREKGVRRRLSVSEATLYVFEP